MFLHWKMFFKIRRHKYFYLLILALPRYPSFSFPKEICVSANRKILEGPVTPQDLHVKQAVYIICIPALPISPSFSVPKTTSENNFGMSSSKRFA